MARTARPWWRSQKQAWCVTVNGSRVQLGPHPESAPAPKYNKRKDTWNVPESIEDRFKVLQRTKQLPVSQDTSWAILDAFLEWCEKNRPASYGWYQARLQRFKDGVPNELVAKLKTSDIQAWLDKQSWGQNYKRGVVTAIRRAFNWARKLEIITRNPAAGVEKPEAIHRDLVISPKDFKKILSLIRREHFRDLLKFFWFCGCRPQEAVRIENKIIDHQHKTITFKLVNSKGKKRRRVIHLTDEAYAIVKKWAKRNPIGPIFRNSHGTPWTTYSIDCRFKRMKKAIGYKVSAYTLRHSYIHHGLTKGKLDPVVMATLAGHSSTDMIFKVYGHLLKDTKFMRAAAKRATAGA